MEGEIITQITNFIGNYGFPIALCIYMMVRFDKTLNQLDDRFVTMATRIDTLIEVLSKDKEK